MKTKVIALLLSILFMGLTVCACTTTGTSEAQAAYKPPAEAFDVQINGTSEPEIEGVDFTYDTDARINTVSYSIDRYNYKQEYSYHSEQIVIKTTCKTEFIEEKTIKNNKLPPDVGFAIVEGYFIRVTDAMVVTDNDEFVENESSTVNAEVPVETSAPQKTVDYSNLVTTERERILDPNLENSAIFRIPKILLDSSDAQAANSEIIQKYSQAFDDENPMLVQLDYTYYIYDDLLSVIVGAHYEGGGAVSYKIYTFDIPSGKELNNNEISDRFSISDAQVISKLHNAEDNHFGDIFDSNWDDSIIASYNDAYEQTVDANNLSNYRLCVGDKGLLAMIYEYTMAGAGMSQVMVDLENEHVYRYFWEFLQDY